MKLTNLKEKVGWYGRAVIAACFLALCATACNDDDKDTTVLTPFDPSKPVVISSFIPETGGALEQIVIKGENFGTSKDNVKLTIGGKEAVVVNVMSDKLYAIVPQKAFSGEITLTVSDDDNRECSTTCDKIFKYEAQTVVGTLCGFQNNNDSQGEVWGSFDICAGFRDEGTLTIDPLYPDRLYVTYDGGRKIALVDLDKKEYSLLLSANKFQQQRLRNVDFSLDGKYMLVSTDRNDQGFKSTSVWIVTRNADGTFSDRSSCQPLLAYKQCNTVAVHPVNGEVYFNSYSNGELFRMNLDEYLETLKTPEEGEEPKTWTGYLEDGAFRELFKIQDPSYEFQVVIHPSGNYAYLTVINRSFILRTDYNWSKKEFTTPYIVAGLNGSGGWVDAVGTNVRVNRPYQGVFVKNPQYEAEGKADVYDYYFADCLNFCVRTITPEGIVRTYAGHSPSTDGNIWGKEDGALRTASRFRDVTGITYDKVRERFYVLDHNNRVIRTIGKESADDDDEEESENPENPTPEAE